MVSFYGLQSELYTVDRRRVSFWTLIRKRLGRLAQSAFQGGWLGL